MQRYRSTYKPRSLRRLERNSKKNILATVLISIVLLYLLITWGLPVLVGSLSFLNKYKSTPKIDPISSEGAIAPPVLNIPFEATNTATIRISGYSNPNSKVEIYVDDDLKTTAETQLNGSFITDTITLSLGTNNIIGKTVNEQGKTSFPSKNIKLTYSNEKPKLELTEPQDGLQIQGNEQNPTPDKKVKVSGQTNPTCSVTINGITTIVNSDGNFSQELAINEGDNIITVIATSIVGNSTQLQRKVTYASR